MTRGTILSMHASIHFSVARCKRNSQKMSNVVDDSISSSNIEILRTSREIYEAQRPPRRQKQARAPARIEEAEREWLGYAKICPSTCMIDTILVFPQYRRQGVGKALLEAATESLFLVHNCPRVSLVASPIVEQQQSVTFHPLLFYKRFGFHTSDPDTQSFHDEHYERLDTQSSSTIPAFMMHMSLNRFVERRQNTPRNSDSDSSSTSSNTSTSSSSHYVPDLSNFRLLFGYWSLGT